jgi:predicted nuclease with TOPRIM domain
MNEKLKKIAQEICELEKAMNEEPSRQANLQKTMDKIMGKLTMEEMMLIDDYILSECNI